MSRLDNYIPVPEAGCWLWLGNTFKFGHGRVDSGDGSSVVAHRAVYEANVGRIPDGMLLLHKCDTPSCVNPDHMFIGTQADNMADKAIKGRQAKGEGHGCAKLTQKQVADIRKLLSLGMKQRPIAKMFGVSQVLVSKIGRGNLWGAGKYGTGHIADKRALRVLS